MFSAELLGALGSAAGDSLGGLVTDAAVGISAGTVLEPYTKPALGSALGMNGAAPSPRPQGGLTGVSPGVYSAANPPSSAFWGDEETPKPAVSVGTVAAVAVAALALWYIIKE